MAKLSSSRYSISALVSKSWKRGTSRKLVSVPDLFDFVCDPNFRGDVKLFVEKFVDELLKEPFKELLKLWRGDSSLPLLGLGGQLPTIFNSFSVVFQRQEYRAGRFCVMVASVTPW